MGEPRDRAHQQELVRLLIEKAGLTLTVDCPPLGEPVYLDRQMYEKIVLNLLSNAFKFTFQGGIEVSLRAGLGQVRLRVADTGVGIPAELPHLFERFYRVEGARGRSYEGSGIGLSLVQELARLHGSMSRARSAAGAPSRSACRSETRTCPRRCSARPPGRPR